MLDISHLPATMITDHVLFSNIKTIYINHHSLPVDIVTKQYVIGIENSESPSLESIWLILHKIDNYIC